MKKDYNTLFWLTVFSIAMGFLETAVVVYLRELYYPNGFNFPLAPIEPAIAVTEFWREMATIVMLLGIACVAGKKLAERFAYFIYCFAIWDIFYYVFLKVLLDWPQSLFTWDILFLIPVPWVGPVIAPCLLSLTMIGLALNIIHLQNKGYRVVIKLKEWGLFITGSLVVILSFVWDYLQFVNTHVGLSSLWTVTKQESLFAEGLTYIPQQFDWWIFWAGELLIVLAIIFFVRRTVMNKSSFASKESKAKPGILTKPSPFENKQENFADYFDGI
jgi:hypothetical protein